MIDLAAGRAELLLMQRRIVEALAKKKGWLTGWAALLAAKSLTEIDLNGNGDTESDEQAGEGISSSAAEFAASILLSEKLSSALASMEDFRSTYEVCGIPRR